MSTAPVATLLVSAGVVLSSFKLSLSDPVFVASGPFAPVTGSDAFGGLAFASDADAEEIFDCGAVAGFGDTVVASGTVGFGALASVDPRSVDEGVSDALSSAACDLIFCCSAALVRVVLGLEACDALLLVVAGFLAFATLPTFPILAL